ncbi:serine hydrolase-like protein [Neophocaena asiaeorientalis asiaeorientalis]|uniref:Serine hydrolase-like protein n=1 Tax=Neophocaena asiaeorientalis asiaeorientalis TaxID=1706337 RepID=A0A341AV51_NEOAA|nr:serine hydrolase-like protein [Neophocaena asiaeorientalis asiaeorientalis]
MTWMDLENIRLIERSQSQKSRATQGFYDLRRENDANTELVLFVTSSLRSTLKERFQYVQVPGNHYVHMNQPQHMAGIISSFLQSKERIPAHL